MIKIMAFTLMIFFFQQYGYVVQIIHSIKTPFSVLKQNIQLKKIAPYQHDQTLERYVQTINLDFGAIKYKIQVTQLIICSIINSSPKNYQ